MPENWKKYLKTIEKKELRKSIEFLYKIKDDKEISITALDLALSYGRKNIESVKNIYEQLKRDTLKIGEYDSFELPKNIKDLSKNINLKKYNELIIGGKDE